MHQLEARAAATIIAEHAKIPHTEPEPLLLLSCLFKHTIHSHRWDQQLLPHVST